MYIRLKIVETNSLSLYLSVSSSPSLPTPLFSLSFAT